MCLAIGGSESFAKVRLQWPVRSCLGRRTPHRLPETVPILCISAESVDSPLLDQSADYAVLEKSLAEAHDRTPD